VTVHVNRSKEENALAVTNPPFNLLAKSDDFWWPQRSLARALLRTQKNTSAYVEAHRNLMDEMRNIIRKEQDLALEISREALEGALRNGRSPDAPKINAVFERAITGLRELGQAWIDAQLRSLESMQSHASGERSPSNGIRRKDMALDRVEADETSRSSTERSQVKAHNA
jgi:hypothetical protein